MKTFFVVSNTMLLTWLRSMVLEKVVIAIVVSISLASWLHDCRTSLYFYLCTDLIPGDFVHVIGDAHVYQTHIRPLQEQLRKLPKPFPVSKKEEILLIRFKLSLCVLLFSVLLYYTMLPSCRF